MVGFLFRLSRRFSVFYDKTTFYFKIFQRQSDCEIFLCFCLDYRASAPNVDNQDIVDSLKKILFYGDLSDYNLRQIDLYVESEAI